MTARRRRRFVRALAALALVAGVLVLVGAWFWNAGRAVRSGELRLPGLQASVEVRFDERGLPHVRASSERDLAYAIGFLHANDRMLQMDLGRRAAAGRLAERLGPGLVELDVAMRRLGLVDVARASLELLGERSRAWIEAYGLGVDAWLELEGRRPGPLLRLVGRPEPWRPVDSLLFAGLMAFRLDAPGQAEAWRADLLRALGAEAVADLTDGRPVAVDEALATWLAGRSGPPAGRPSVPTPDERGGSNAWGVAGLRSTSGAPLLASDPHLPLGLPASWYAMVLECPTYSARGMTLPGVPSVLIGQSELRAFALTNAQIDGADWFLEEYDERAESVRRGERSVAVDVREEVFDVRFGERQERVLRQTDIGPLFVGEGGLPARSLAWTGRVPGDPLEVFLRLASEPDWERVMESVARYPAPAQNLVVAEHGGALRHVVIGALPVRTRGDGRLPVTAESGGWVGFHPESVRPVRDDRSGGVIVSANDDVLAGRTPSAADYADASRRDRIGSLLVAEPRWDIEALSEVQLDVGSPFFGRLRDALLSRLGEGADGPGVERLRSLDDVPRVDGLDGAFLRRLARELWEHTAGEVFRQADVAPPGERRRERLVLSILEGDVQHAWVLGERTLDERCRDALDEARAEPRDSGPELRGTAILRLEHALDSLPLLGPTLGAGPRRLDGHWSTVQALWSGWKGNVVSVYGGASMRFVADLADPRLARYVLPGGQAGHPADRRSRDQLDGWATGRLFPLDVPDDGAASELRLRPLR